LSIAIDIPAANMANSLAGAAGAAKILAAVERWLLDRVVPVNNGAVSLRASLGAWRSEFAAPAKRVAADRRQRLRRIFQRRAVLEYRALASAPQPALLLQKAVFQRLLRNEELTWLDPPAGNSGDAKMERQWPVLADGQALLSFSPFSVHLVLALNNALCVLDAVGVTTAADQRHAVREFYREAARQLPRRAATPSTRPGQPREFPLKLHHVTFGDLLAAQIMCDAVADLGREFEQAADQASEKRFIERFWLCGWYFRHQWVARRAAAMKLADWARRRLQHQFARLNPLAPLLIRQQATDEAVAAAMDELVCHQVPPAIAGWIAGRVARQICDGQSSALMTAVRKLLAREQGEAFAARVVLEMIEWLRRQIVARKFDKLRDAAGDDVSGLFTDAAIRLIARNRKGDAPVEELPVWKSLEAAFARVMWMAIQSGLSGHLFAGRFLVLLGNEGHSQSLAELSAGIATLELFRLMREWLRVTEDEKDDGIIKLRKSLAAAHPEMQGIIRIQETVSQARRHWASN
jgi:hypothetical protein